MLSVRSLNHVYRRSLAVIAGAALFLATCGRAVGQPIPLAGAGVVHDLAPELAAKSLPVHLLATVAYYDPERHDLFVSDASGAVYVETNRAYPLRRGDLVQIDGVTRKSYRTTVVAATIRVLGRGVLTPAVVLGAGAHEQLMAGRWDCRFVTVRGTVRSALIEQHGAYDILELELMLPGGLVQAYVRDHQGLDPARLIDAEVQFSGSVGGVFNAQIELVRGGLYAADAGGVQVVQAPRAHAFSLPLTPIGAVAQTEAIENRSPRLRVRGAVTFSHPGQAVVIEQDRKGLVAVTRQQQRVPLGSIVDVIGFADEATYGAALGQAEILPTGAHTVVEPIPVSYADAISGMYTDDLVSLQGQVISVLHSDAQDTLTVMVDRHAVTAVLAISDVTGKLPKLPPGTSIALTGICRVMATRVTTGVAPMLFRVDLRSSNDLRIVHWPSWWTVEHVLVLAGALSAVLLLISAWALVLRNRVAHQTAQIARTMRLEKERSRLLEAINSELALHALLKEICLSVERLAPGLCCYCSLQRWSSEPGSADDISVGQMPEHVLFETALTDPKGVPVGLWCAGGSRSAPLSAFEKELVNAGSSLASLAVHQRRMYEELNYSSAHDQLTGLPNRRSADFSLETALQKAALRGDRVGVAYIDIDHFKQVNDRYGHKVGDVYLQQTAARLSCSLRGSDTLARIGGDEFLFIATALNSLEEAEGCRERLRNCFESSFVLEGCRLRGSASVGLAVFPDHGRSAEELKRHADMDMYSAKQGREAENGSEYPFAAVHTDIYSPADLQVALAAGQFSLFYQPQFSCTGELRGLEALLRLNDPILGTVTPDAFIGMAERNDVIVPLGRWVLREALSDAASWEIPQCQNVRMVLNVSARELENARYAEEVLATLREFGVSPNSLELEITERTMMQSLAPAVEQLTLLQAQGVRIAIDDFGTGFSSLSCLHQLPIDTLKLDRSFLRALSSRPEVLHIIEAIVTMARSLGKRIVVEGVETEADVGALAQLGDVDVQGYFFSRPQPAEIVTAQLGSWCASSSRVMQKARSNHLS